jgi:hypothetical protein
MYAVQKDVFSITMLYVQYIHLTKVKAIHKRQTLSSESILHKVYDRKCSVAKKKIFGRESQGTWRQD